MIRILRLIILNGIFLGLAGCVSMPPPLTKAQWIEATTRQYKATPEQVLNAAEKLFRLADGDDFKMQYSESSLHATRPWGAYMVIMAVNGVDYWAVDTKMDGEKTLASVKLATTSSAMGPMTTIGGDWTLATQPGAVGLVNGTAIYDIFWARMDWLLGLRSSWMTCKESDEKVKVKSVWGMNDALCNSFNMKDISPGESDRIIVLASTED